jgi:hypothetical protein
MAIIGGAARNDAGKASFTFSAEYPLNRRPETQLKQSIRNPKPT